LEQFLDFHSQRVQGLLVERTTWAVPFHLVAAQLIGPAARTRWQPQLTLLSRRMLAGQVWQAMPFLCAALLEAMAALLCLV
jgi:hypothetical protein